MHLSYLGQFWSFHSPPGSPMEVTASADVCEMLPQRGRGKSVSMCDTGEGGGARSHAHILQKLVAGLVRVTTSHKEQTSP